MLNRITRTKKYKLGKSKTSNNVGVLIKNRDLQHTIKKELQNMRTTPIQDIKNYLREKNLIKLGSDAPTDVLRKIYENAILSGEVINDNPENLLHNYMTD